jgi:hypothetical protein
MFIKNSSQTSVQYKAIWNCHNESPLYNVDILLKLGLKYIVVSLRCTLSMSSILGNITKIFPFEGSDWQA